MKGLGRFMFNQMRGETFLTIIFSLLGVIIVCLSTLIIYLTSRLKETERALDERFFLRVAKDFLQKFISETKQRIRGVNEEIIKSYKKQFEDIDQEIQSLSSQISAQLTEESEKIRNKMMELGQEIEKEIPQLKETSSKAGDLLAQEIKRTMKELTQNMEKEISKVYQSVENTLNQQMAETKAEIENYKKEKLKEVEQKIFLLIKKVAKETMGKAIPLPTHEELVIEALKKAKKEIF